MMSIILNMKREHKDNKQRGKGDLYNVIFNSEKKNGKI